MVTIDAAVWFAIIGLYILDIASAIKDDLRFRDIKKRLSDLELQMRSDPICNRTSYRSRYFNNRIAESRKDFDSHDSNAH